MTQRILVIDDDPTIQQFAATVLQASGFQVETAASGLAGLGKAGTHPPALVLLDVMMPGLDGYEVCRKLRQGAKTAEVPVIMLTASNEPGLNRKAYEAGAHACVLKPIRIESLIATINAVLASTAKGKGGTPPDPKQS